MLNIEVTRKQLIALIKLFDLTYKQKRVIEERNLGYYFGYESFNDTTTFIWEDDTLRGLSNEELIELFNYLQK